MQPTHFNFEKTILIFSIEFDFKTTMANTFIYKQSND